MVLSFVFTSRPSTCSCSVLGLAPPFRAVVRSWIFPMLDDLGSMLVPFCWRTGPERARIRLGDLFSCGSVLSTPVWTDSGTRFGQHPLFKLALDQKWILPTLASSRSVWRALTPLTVLRESVLRKETFDWDLAFALAPMPFKSISRSSTCSVLGLGGSVLGLGARARCRRVSLSACTWLHLQRAT